MDLYSYIKSVLNTKLHTNSNSYVKLTLYTDFYIQIYIQDITYGFNRYVT